MLGKPKVRRGEWRHAGHAYKVRRSLDHGLIFATALRCWQEPDPMRTISVISVDGRASLPSRPSSASLARYGGWLAGFTDENDQQPTGSGGNIEGLMPTVL